MGERRLRIAHVIGARPHFMKLAPVYHVAKADGMFDQMIIHTGQHYDESLSGAFLKEFDLPDPDYNLEVGSLPHLSQIGSILLELDDIISDIRPDMIFVYGDTNSTLAGAIAASKRNIPLAHIEAGLREYDKSIPEEVNKLLIDAVADLLFCPTRTAVDNLKKEGTSGQIHLVGDVVVDLLKKNKQIIPSGFQSEHDLLTGSYYFATCHRAINTERESNLREILEAYDSLDKPVVFPLHPRTRTAMLDFGIEELLQSDNIRVIDPIGFWETQGLIKNAHMTITDSGGVIKESCCHGTPCIITDYQTEWVEAVSAGWAIIAGPDKERILKAAHDFTVPEKQSDIFGDGKASTRILEYTKEYLDQQLAIK